MSYLSEWVYYEVAIVSASPLMSVKCVWSDNNKKKSNLNVAL